MGRTQRDRGNRISGKNAGRKERNCIIGGSSCCFKDKRSPYIGETVALECKTGDDETTIQKFTVTGWYQDERLYDINKEGILYTSEEFAAEYGKTPEKDGTVYFSFYKNKIVNELQILYRIFTSAKDISSDEHKIKKLMKDLPVGESQSIKRIYRSPVFVYDAFGNLTDYLLVIIPVMICGFLLIFDCFYLSIAKDIRSCGLLMSVGGSFKQLRAIIRGQALILAAAGISAGFILSMIVSVYMVPTFLNAASIIDKKIYFTWTFSSYLLAALLTFITVLAGSRAVEIYLGRISIIELIRFESIPKRKKCFRIFRVFHFPDRNQRVKAGRICRMAASNVLRNAKVNLHVILSLFIAAVVFLLISVMVSGMNPKGFAAYRLEDHDFALYNETFSINYVDSENPDTTGTPEHVFNDRFMTDLKKQEGINYFNTVQYLPVAIRMDPNVLGKYIEYHDKIDGYGVPPEYGAYEIGDLWIADTSYFLEHLNEKQKKEMDFKKLEQGKAALVLSLYPEQHDLFPEHFSMEGYLLTTEEMRKLYRSGQTGPLEVFLNLSGNKAAFSYEKGGYYPPLLDNVASLTVVPPALYVNESAVKDFGIRPVLYKIELNTDAAHRLSMETYLEEAVFNHPSIYLESRSRLVATMEAYKNSAYIFGYLFTVIIALIGILGLINMSTIHTKMRKNEFAVLRSIGMTKKQLYQMLAMEGIYCAMILCFSILTAGSFLVCKLYQYMKTAYETFHYPVIPLIGICVFTTISLTVIPLAVYSSENRKSISQALREME